MRKAERQSRWLAIQPPKKTPSAEPIGMPSEKKASARARLSFGIEIGDQRVGRRDAARLADADAHPRQEQLPEILRQPAGGGEHAPQGDRRGDDVDPALAVGEPGDRDGEARIEEREGDPAHQPELGVGERRARP